jgi:hypothetical protein
MEKKWFAIFSIIAIEQAICARYLAPTATKMSCYHGDRCLRLVFTLHAEETKAHDITFVFRGSLRIDKASLNSNNMQIITNGISLTSLIPSECLPATSCSSTLALRRGANIIELSFWGSHAAILRDSFHYLDVAGSLDAPAAGASLPYTEVEAEDASFSGIIIGPNYTFTSLPSEASQRKAVVLQGPSQFVEFVVPATTNAITVRYSIPDAPSGGGLDSQLVVTAGSSRVTASITSRYAWYYGSYPFTKRPSDGHAHHFYDEVSVRLPQALAKGEKLHLAPTSSDLPITVDLVDFFFVDPPLPQPANSLSILTTGADPTGAHDSTQSIQTAITRAQASGQIVWVPPGNFTVTQHLIVDNVTLAGAGMWYSLFHGNGVGVYGKNSPNPSKNVHVRDLAIMGEVKIRDDGSQVNGLGGALSNSIVSNVWISHTKCGAWLDGPMDNLLLSGLIIRDTTADGVNFHVGVTNSVVEHSTLRNLGDDGLAMWSDRQPDASNSFRFNTIQVPVLANNIAIYGGHDNSVLNNFVADTITQGGGLHVGNRFSSVALAGTTTISGNTAVRTGCMDPNWRFGVGALWFFALDSAMTGAIVASSNILRDSPYEAIQFIGSRVDNVALSNVTIDGAGTFAFQFQCAGSGVASGVRASGVGFFGQYNCGVGFALRDGGGNSGWNTTHCGWPPSLPFQ